jgi:hypothetical protein
MVVIQSHKCVTTDVRLLAMLIGHMDDSGSVESHLFTLSCLVGHGGMWQWIEWAWLQCLEKKNKQLKAEGRTELSRYHASDCSFRHNEFADWTVPEQIELTEQLIRIFRNHSLVIVSYTLDLRDLVAEFPEAKGDPRALAHVLLLTHIMKYIAEKILNDPRYLKDRIAMIHDRGAYDAVLLEAFNHVKKDETLINHDRFTTISPMGWEDCIPLQPADLIAYGNFKVVERESGGHKRRKDFASILDLNSIGGRGVKIQRAGLREIREKLDEESMQVLFRNARIRPIPKPGRDPHRRPEQRKKV